MTDTIGSTREPGLRSVPDSALPPEDVVEAVPGGANPFVGLTPGQVARAGARWAQALARHPRVLGDSVGSWLADEVRVLSGASEVHP